MKKLLISALFVFVLTLTLSAQVNRLYVQKIVCANSQDITLLVTNLGETHCPAYTMMAYLLENPAEVISTENTSPANLRICLMGNGTSLPYYAVAVVELGAFPSGWFAGGTIRVDVTHTASGETTFWEKTIPGGIGPIVVQSPTQTVPPSIIVPTQEALAPAPLAQLTSSPNPFRSATTISYYPAKGGLTSLAICNLKGQVVRSFANGYQDSSHHSINWDGRDDEGKPVAPGIYLCTLRTAGRTLNHKLMLMK